MLTALPWAERSALWWNGTEAATDGEVHVRLNSRHFDESLLTF
jgi:hypothetical protein